eukprot:317219-Prymnesium_polylepis.1
MGHRAFLRVRTATVKLARRPTLTWRRLRLRPSSDMLINGSRPLVLRDYQTQCADAIIARNVLCALPVGSGKTVIAAE